MPFDKKSLSAAEKRSGSSKWRGFYVSVAVSFLAAGCAAQDRAQLQPAGLAAPKKNLSGAKAGKKRGQNFYAQGSYSGRLTERRCLERAMFFESNRSSREGLLAVGTVVMNRVHSSQYPNTICAVVGQRSQFAPGVLTRPMNIAITPDVAAAADAVLRGERSPRLKNAMYFHTAGMRFPYNNMHYVLVAGGNSFYEKRRRDGSLSTPVNDETYDVAYAFAQDKGEILPAAAELDGAASAMTDNIKTASIMRSSARGRLLQTAYRPAGAYENAAAAANAALSTVYDSRNVAEQSRANEARAEMVSYTPDTVPVPQMKAVFTEGDMASAAETPHFIPVSAPQAEEGGRGAVHAAAGAVSVSYKAPDVEKAGAVGAALLGGKP